MCHFQFTKTALSQYNAPAFFPPVNNYAKLTHIERNDWHVAKEDLKKGLMDGVRLDVFFPGFPTLKHIPHVSVLKETGDKVFEQSSRGENMLLKLTDQGHPSIEDVAKQLLGSEIWVSWPHMVEAKVMKVMSKQKLATLNNNDGNINWIQCSEEDFSKTVTQVSDRYKDRYGILVGNTEVIIYASPIRGRKVTNFHNFL